jgi:hypothetical protein
MKALTVWQPWASLIAAGVKPYEFRGRTYPLYLQAQRIVIHAAQRKVRRDEVRELILRLEREGGWGLEMDVARALPLLHRWLQSPEILPLSTGLCTAKLDSCVHVLRLPSVAAHPERHDEIARGMWGWHLTEIEPLPMLEPVKGAQGFWEWPIAA